MSIEIRREPRSFGPPFEECCFCGEVTVFWTFPVTGDSVACCQECSWRHVPYELPSKVEWCADWYTPTHARRLA